MIPGIMTYCAVFGTFVLIWGGFYVNKLLWALVPPFAALAWIWASEINL
jgi:hypothetical protein